MEELSQTCQGGRVVASEGHNLAVRAEGVALHEEIANVSHYSCAGHRCAQQLPQPRGARLQRDSGHGSRLQRGVTSAQGGHDRGVMTGITPAQGGHVCTGIHDIGHVCTGRSRHGGHGRDHACTGGSRQVSHRHRWSRQGSQQESRLHRGVRALNLIHYLLISRLR